MNVNETMNLTSIFNPHIYPAISYTYIYIGDVIGNGLVGTPYYLSPELCKGVGGDDKSDVWALGCILYELVTLRRPFEASNLPAIIMAILKGHRLPIDLKRYSAEMDNVRVFGIVLVCEGFIHLTCIHLHMYPQIISMCLQPSPAKRPRVTDIYNMGIVQTYLQKWRQDKLSIDLPRPPLMSVKSSGDLLRKSHSYTNETGSGDFSPHRRNLLTFHFHNTENVVASSSEMEREICEKLNQLAQQARTRYFD